MTTTLIVGLGNPGRRYAHTRHNIGFMVVDVLAHRLQAGPWREEQRASVSRARLGDDIVLLAKPQTFMNNSGQAVRALMAYYRIAPADVLVINDDLDLPFGRLRLRPQGTPGGHNGLRSISAEIGTEDFPRLRIGIGRPAQGDPIDWVLTPFDDQEARDLDYVCQVAADVVLQALRDGLVVAMNALNGRRDVRDPVPEQDGPSDGPIGDRRAHAATAKSNPGDQQSARAAGGGQGNG